MPIMQIESNSNVLAQLHCRDAAYLLQRYIKIPNYQPVGTKKSLADAPSTINWISTFSEFNRYMAIFRKFFESKRKCKCLIIITLPFWLVPCLFARFESFSSECIIPLDFNEFLSVRYMFQLRCKVTHFSRKTCRMCYFFIVHPNV